MAAAQEKMLEWLEPVEQEQKPRLRRRQPVKKNQRRLAKWQSIIFLTVVVGLMAALAAASIHLTVVQGAEVRNLEKEIADLKVRKANLQMEADQLRAVSRIESEALAMGMEKPAGTVYITSSLPPLSALPLLPDLNAVLSVQTAISPLPETKTTLDKVKGFAQTFTSFFASTQR